MPQATSRIHTVPETDLHEAVTRVGFLLSYSALMALVISTTAPFLSDEWSSMWAFTLVMALVAALLVVGGLFVWRKAISPGV